MSANDSGGYRSESDAREAGAADSTTATSPGVEAPSGVLSQLIDPWSEVLFEGSRDAIFLSDAQSRFVAVNRAACELTGFPRDELLAMSIPDLHEDVDLEAYRGYHARILGGEDALTRAAIRRKDGRKVEAEFSNRAVTIAGTAYMHTTARDVTERWKAEEALVRSEARFRELVENLNDVVYAVGLDGVISYVSPAVEAVLGFTPEEVVGRPFRDLVHPDDVGALRVAFAEVLAGELKPREYRLRYRSGGFRWVRTSSRPLVEGGAVAGLRGVLTDISEARAAREALAESERRFRTTLENVGLVAVGLDSAGEVAFVNDFTLELTGWNRDEVIGCDWFDRFVPADRRDAIRQLFRRAAEGDDLPSHVENPIMTRAGEERLIEWSNTILRDRDGRVTGSVSIGEDVTEHRRAEHQLRTSERRYRTLFESAPVGIFTTRSTGEVLAVNAAMARMLGAESVEAIQNHYSNLSAQLYVDPSRRRVFLRQLEEHGLVEGFEYDAYTIDGRTVRLSMNARLAGRDEHGGFLIEGFTTDITAQSELEAQLRHAQKMEAIGQLAGGVAHDFNNLLQAMLTQAQLVGTCISDPARLATVVEELEQQVQRGAGLTRQLLLFSRRDAVQRRRLDLNDVIRGQAKLLRHLVRENIAFRLDLAEGALPVEGDHGQLEQVVMNLVVNASDALEHGGEVAIRSGRGDDGGVWLAVEDDGPGVPPALRTRIFEPFFTTKPADKGTGLGLSVVHGIVDRHGGGIAVEERGGGGSVFRVTLPSLTPQDQENSGERVDDRQDLKARTGQQILIVEDEPAAREALVELLDALGYGAIAVGSAEEAVALAETAAFDVLLTDLVLPGASGAELAKRLCGRWPELRVIMMSGYTEDDVVKRGIGSGDVRFLQKPFGMKTLAEELRRVLRSSRGSVR